MPQVIENSSIFWVFGRLQHLPKRRERLYIRILDYCNIPGWQIAMGNIKSHHIKARQFPGMPGKAT
jgi:hypothetical protein